MIALIITIVAVLVGFRIVVISAPAVLFCVFMTLIDRLAAPYASMVDLSLFYALTALTSIRATCRARKAERRGQTKMLDLIEHVSQSGASPERSRAAGD
jgi:hypothetical protein